MGNPFNHFWLFIGAVGVHAVTLAAGCIVTVVINLIEKYVIKKSLPWQWDIAILLLFMFIACFQAWRDQYEIAAKVNQAPPVQITNQVNVPPTPAPIINIPSHMAYVDATNLGVVVDQYKVGGRWAVSGTFKNLSPTEIAENAGGIQALRVVATKENELKQHIVANTVTENTWQQFKKETKSMKEGRRSYGPGESYFATVWSPPIDEKEDKEFRSASKTIMFLAYFSWTDGAGKHTNEVCKWLQVYPEMFTGTTIASNATITWNGCKNHNGLKK